MKKYIKKIQDKRKHTDPNDFIMDLMSWVPMNFYKNDDLISRYPETSRSPNILDNQEFEDIRDTLVDYGCTYDDSLGFFEQFSELYKRTPTSATVQQMAGENTDYADMVVESRNTYLSNIVCGGSENIYYSFSVVLASKNVFSSARIRRSENIYYSFGIDKCQNIFYSKFIKNSSNVYLSANLVGCHDCLLCEGLENMNYCIKNKQYSKSEYHQKKSEILKDKAIYEEFYRKINSKPKNINSHNSQGVLLVGCEDCTEAISVNDMKTGRNIMFGGGGENYYDCFDFGVGSHDFYGVVSTGTYSNHIYCSNLIESSSQIFYSMNCNTSHHLFGCVGLQNKSYCILNKQYTKEDWGEKVEKIMGQMDREGSLGDFFPAGLNPFYFNHTLAGMMTGLSKDEVLKKDFLYQDREESPEGQDFIASSELISFIDREGEISEDILDVTIKGSHGRYYTVIKPELDFLNKYSLPIPTQHWSDRIAEHMGNLKL